MKDGCREHAGVKVLVIEDDRSLREGLAMNLRLNGYETIMAADGESGMKAAFDARPDLIVLDIMLPGWTGTEILGELRSRGENVPVLILSARNTTPDKIEGLRTGADDYMTKPFDLSELIARIEALLRRRGAAGDGVPSLVLGDILVDRAARLVTRRGKAVALSAKEFELLCLLAASPGRVFTRDGILEKVWGWDYEGTARTVDNFVVSLRRKLKISRPGGVRIATVRGVGYRLEVA
ncbi:MAG: response regulator transcription factor [Lentisphaerae bacterium]|nr:response regulator transcription factor [Lentisphaerota bacterium]